MKSKPTEENTRCRADGPQQRERAVRRPGLFMPLGDWPGARKEEKSMHIQKVNIRCWTKAQV